VFFTSEGNTPAAPGAPMATPAGGETNHPVNADRQTDDEAHPVDQQEQRCSLLRCAFEEVTRFDLKSEEEKF